MVLKRIRQWLAAIFFFLVTMLFLDFTGVWHEWFGWMAKVQFVPALLALNVAVVVGLVVLTLLFGRVYCSVICPLGVFQDVVSRMGGRFKKNRFRYSPALSWLRWPVLLVFVVFSVAGLISWAGLVEPYSAYGRMASNLLAPLYRWGNNALAYFAERADSYAFYETDVWIRGGATLVVAVLSVVSITVANLMAILQTDLKRFMAFSSISQAGYIVLGALAGTAQGMASMAYYIAVYVVANVAVFAVISTIEQHPGGLTSRDDYRGLYRTNPRLTLVMTLALFSLGGIPPFAGFFSKFFIFAAAFEEGWWVVVFLALLNTIISLYYYLLVVKAMYISEPEDGRCVVAPMRSAPGVRLCLVLCVAGICALGLCSGFYEGLEYWAEAL